MKEQRQEREKRVNELASRYIKRINQLINPNPGFFARISAHRQRQAVTEDPVTEDDRVLLNEIKGLLRVEPPNLRKLVEHFDEIRLPREISSPVRALAEELKGELNFFFPEQLDFDVRQSDNLAGIEEDSLRRDERQAGETSKSRSKSRRNYLLTEGGFQRDFHRGLVEMQKGEKKITHAAGDDEEAEKAKLEDFIEGCKNEEDLIEALYARGPQLYGAVSIHVAKEVLQTGLFPEGFLIAPGNLGRLVTFKRGASWDKDGQAPTYNEDKIAVHTHFSWGAIQGFQGSELNTYVKVKGENQLRPIPVSEIEEVHALDEAGMLEPILTIEGQFKYTYNERKGKWRAYCVGMQIYSEIRGLFSVKEGYQPADEGFFSDKSTGWGGVLRRLFSKGSKYQPKKENEENDETNEEQTQSGLPRPKG